MKLKQRIAIFASATCGTFAAAGFCLLSADLLNIYSQSHAWMRQIGWPAAGVGLCLWAYLSAIAPGRPEDWYSARPRIGGRWTVTVVVLLLCGTIGGAWVLLGEPRHSKLLANLLFDIWLLSVPLMIWIRWGVWNDALDAWAAYQQRQRDRAR
jgi:hypothetical protein